MIRVTSTPWCGCRYSLRRSRDTRRVCGHLRLRLYPEGFFAVPLPVPPLSEQCEIVAHIANGTRKLDELRAATERTTVLLKERRAALIAAAVTGQIDVEQAA